MRGICRSQTDGSFRLNRLLIFCQPRTAFPAFTANHCPSPLSRSSPGDPFEGAIEARLVCESTLTCDAGKGQTRVQQEILSLLNPAFQQPSIGWFAEGVLESSREVTQRYLAYLCYPAEVDVSIQMGVQKLCRSSH